MRLRQFVENSHRYPSFEKFHRCRFNVPNTVQNDSEFSRHGAIFISSDYVTTLLRAETTSTISRFRAKFLRYTGPFIHKIPLTGLIFLRFVII